MNSLVLRTAAVTLKPLMLLFSVFLFVRGHNEPGGGFVAGLVAAAGFALGAYAHHADHERRRMIASPLALIALGLITAVLSGMPGLLQGRPYFSSMWVSARLPMFGEMKVGTPLVFDAGVYMLVCGVALQLILLLKEKDEEEV